MKLALSARPLAIAALAATLGATALPHNAQAAWRGLRAFECGVSRGNWTFDGLYGPFTTRAVRNFQHAHNIHVDGIAGPETYKAMGLKFRRTLRCGMGGNDVFLLQQTLAAAGYWYGGEGSPNASPAPTPHVMPTKKPRPRPTPAFTSPPVLDTPAPTTAPTEAPTAEPTAAPMATPTPEETPSIPENRPTFEIQGGNWMVPQNAGSTNYDYTFMRPTWTGGVGVWLGDFGLAADLTDFNQTYTTYRSTSYFPQNTMMYDALLKYRFDHGYYNVFAGYRGIGLADVNFGTIGVGLDRPLIGDWLWLQAQAQAGHNFSSSYFAEGQAGLGLRISVLELQLGFRHFAFQNGAVDPLFNMNGPIANVKLQF